jgi:hypothetical protein
MRNLSLVIIALAIILIGIASQVTQEAGVALKQPVAPHGDSFKVGCSVCHSEKGWVIDQEIYSFNHDLTKMPLVGQHTQINCKLCHPTLVFSEAKNECAECHIDVHESTVGNECSRCHTPHSWLVNNITQIHQQSRFPLVGVHATVDCYQCHKSETFRRFEVLGTECYNCHIGDYVATTQPNHISVGYPTQCNDCHSIFSKEWKGTGFNHNFFPLTLGHSLISCDQCHTSGTPAKISSECISCHQAEYNSTSNPAHPILNFSNNCTECHTTNPGWKPASFRQHDVLSFPIYSGNHQGEWNSCTDCHSNTANYKVFSCIDCHEHNKSDMDNEHEGESGYSYNSISCLNCHPRGSED